MTTQPLLDVQDLTVRFRTPEGIVYAVNNVSFHLGEGETLAVVGESGSGKSVSMLSILGLLPVPPGEIVSGKAFYRGADLLAKTDQQMEALRGDQIAMIFQDPMTSLNPVLTVGYQVAEALACHLNLERSAAQQRAADMLALVGIPDARQRLGDYPHQFSGGMRQRVMIAMALACRPSLLIADEPTTALDVTIQAQILELVARLRQEYAMAVIWISHDLGVVAGMADRVAVMYAGSVVETADVFSLYETPRHPYTLALLSALPRLDQRSHRRLQPIHGAPPNLLAAPASCPFAPRCTYAAERCRLEKPPLACVAENHLSACWLDPRGAQE